jgi:hypothetical protein
MQGGAKRAIDDVHQHKGEPAMRKAAALLVAAMFALGSMGVVAQDKKDVKKPTAAECKKDPKLAGCETKDEMKKDAKK